MPFLMTFPFSTRQISLTFTKSKHLRVSIAVVELLRTTTQTDAPAVEVKAAGDFLSFKGVKLALVNTYLRKSFLFVNRKSNCNINLCKMLLCQLSEKNRK